MHPDDRIEVLGQLGAHLVPIANYVQPQLDAGKKPSTELLLLAFDPNFESAFYDNVELCIPEIVCEEFLVEYYRVQNADEPENKTSLQKMIKELHQAIGAGPQTLTEILPNVPLRRVTIT